MDNAYGLDADYFIRLCKREFNDDVIGSQTPSDLARAFARASRTADASVMNEPEFTRELSAEVERLRDALESSLAMFPVKLERQAFYLNATPLLADDDDRFYSVKKVDAFIEGIRAALAGSKEGV